MLRRKMIRFLALSMTAATLFTGCGGGSSAPADSSSAGSSTPAADAGEKPAEPAADSGEKVTIRMIESLTSPERTAVLREIADKYQTENPNVTVEIISPPLEGADQKISQMLQSKQPLDVVECREQTITQFMTNEWIAPLNDYLTDWEGNATLTEAAKSAMTIYSLDGESVYLLPYGFYQRCLYYRKDWFEEAGLEAPKSYEDIYNAGLKLTDPTKNRYGWSFRGGMNGYAYVDMILWADLGYDKLAGDTAAFWLKDGSTIFSTQEAKDAFAFYKDIYKNISPADSIAWGFSEMVQGFVGGTTAMLIQDPEVIATCSASMQPEQWGVVPMPVGKSGQAMFPNGFAGWSMTSYSEHPAETADFIKFLSNSDNNTYFAKNYSTIPIHSDAAEKDSYFSEGAFSVYMEMAKQPDVYKFTIEPQQYLAFAAWRAEVDQWIQKYLNDTMTEDELLKYLDDYWTKAVEDEGKILW